MTRQQSFKRRVRGRMARTGESYTIARRQLLTRARARSEPPISDVVMVHAVPTTLAPDSRSEARRRTFLETRRRRLEQVTQRSTDEWISILDKAGAREMTHREIWRWLADGELLKEGMLRENLVIAYEQAIGRREVGQSCYGDYHAAATRVLTGTLDDALQAWLELVGGVQAFNGVALAGEPRVSASEKYRYWRARLADGTHVDVDVYKGPDGRIPLGVQHRPFPERAAADAWRGYWREFVAQLTRKEVA